MRRAPHRPTKRTCKGRECSNDKLDPHLKLLLLMMMIHLWLLSLHRYLHLHLRLLLLRVAVLALLPRILRPLSLTIHSGLLHPLLLQRLPLLGLWTTPPTLRLKRHPVLHLLLRLRLLPRLCANQTKARTGQNKATCATKLRSR